MTTQYVKISFKPGGRLYTYINNEPTDLQVGDIVELEGKGMLAPIEVVEVSTQPFDDLPTNINLLECWKV